MTTLLLIIVLALALDRLMPDRAGFQLWQWYGDWTESIEQRFNGGLRAQGVYAVILAVVPIAVAVLLASFVLNQIAALLAILFAIAVLYLCVDLQRLNTTAGRIAAALDNDDVAEAGSLLAGLTGKPTVETTTAGVAQAAVEAVLKQANTLIAAPLFWFLVLGPLGAMVQRLVASLDRQWGHKTPRFAEFGWAAARLDDLINWVPARITALSYAVMGSFEDALYCWRRRAHMWSDLSSGPLLGSGLGALHLDTCEPTGEQDVYGNTALNPDALPSANDVRRALALVWRVLLFWLVIGTLMSAAHLAGFITR